MRVLATLTLLLRLAIASDVQSATFTVDSTVDAVDAAPGDGTCGTAGGACTLRAAIQETNALAGADTIVLPAGTYELTIPGTEVVGAAGDLDVDDIGLDIVGAGSGVTIIDGKGIDRVFDFHFSQSQLNRHASISGVTIQHGIARGGGGGILCQVNLLLTDVVVRENVTTFGLGGGIQVNVGLVTLVDSQVRDNVTTGAVSHGGGIFSDSAVSLVRTSVTGNVAEGDGGGVYVFFSTLSARNSTISDNRAAGNGGGLAAIFFHPTQLVSLRETTITRNVADSERRGVGDGGGVYLTTGPPPDQPGEVDIANSIIGDNDDFGGEAPDCGGLALTSLGYNVFGTTTGCTVGGDLTGNVTGNPLLGPLQLNGGPTPTHAPLPGSPALEAGNPAAPGSGGNACAATDQRSAARPVGARCDVGAVETGCGNAAPDPGETCDDGNVVDGDGCDSNCTTPGCGNGIVTGGEACDDGAGNGIDGCCSASCQLVDADADGVCDRSDACLGGTTIQGLRVTLQHPGGPGDHDTFRLGGDAVLAFPFDPPLDPLTHGFRLVLADAAGNVFDAMAPGVSFPDQIHDGWKASSSGTRWSYTRGIYAGLTPTRRLRVAGNLRVAIVRKPKTPGLVHFTILARGVSLSLSPALPIRVTTVFDVPQASGGQCADATVTCTPAAAGRYHCA